MGRLVQALGLLLVGVGAFAAAWRPPVQPASCGRVLVLVDAAAMSNADVRAAFVAPGPPSRVDAAAFAVRESPFERWGVPEVADIATQADHFDAVVAVSDGGAALDAAEARAVGERLAARGAPVSVVLVPLVPQPAPAPPPADARKLPPPLRPARTLRVLYVEQMPRWEYNYLSNAMCRDADLLARTWLADSDPETPQRRSQRADWPKGDFSAGFPSVAAMDEYDVLVLGDVDPASIRGDDTPSRDVAAEISAWVESGRGLLLIAGPQNMPCKWTASRLTELLPVVPAPPRAPRDPSSGFRFVLTPEGAAHPVLDIAADLAESRRLWESDNDWIMYWACPATLAPGATALAYVGDDPTVPVLATRSVGRGRVFYLGVDDLWRTRRDAGDTWFLRFYGAAIAWLAEPRAGVVATPKVEPPPPPPPAPPPPTPPGAAALRAIAESSGGKVCAPADASELVASLSRVRGPAPPAPPRDPWTIAMGAVVALCGAFFLWRGRGT